MKARHIAFDTAGAVLVVGITLFVHGVGMMGYEPSWSPSNTFGRLRADVPLSIVLNSLIIICLVILGFGKRYRDNGILVAGIFVGVALANFWAFDPGVGTLLMFSASALLRRCYHENKTHN